MRKLKLQVQISIDGFIAGPNSEMDWMTWDWDDELKNYVNNLHTDVDCILLGRVLAEGFIPAWTERIANPETEDAFGHKMIDTPKVVFSRTLKKVPWPNTELAEEDLAEAVKRIKEEPGGDIVAYGGSRFVSSLILHNLIDEYHLFVNPAAMGNGLRIFTERTPLKLVKGQSFDCGIVVLHYAPAQ